MKEQPKTNFVLSDSAYNKIKPGVQLVIPAVSSLYFGLAAIWGLPGAEQVTGTLALVATFFGATLGISSKNFNATGPSYDGDAVVTIDGGGMKSVSLELEGNPEEFLETQDEIRFRVKRTHTEPSD